MFSQGEVMFITSLYILVVPFPICLSMQERKARYKFKTIASYKTNSNNCIAYTLIEIINKVIYKILLDDLMKQ